MLEKEYLLIQDATIEKVTNRGIQKGDIVYVTYTLFDQSKEAIFEYENIEVDFCVGDLEFSGYERYGNLYGLTLEEVLEMFDLSKEIVQKNADYFEGSWEVAQYIIKEEELQLSTKEMEKAQEEYAKENGYENAEDLLLDCGLQYVTEEIYIEIVKDFLYEQAEKR